MSLFGDPLDETAARWREALIETVRPLAEAKLPLLLSGGIDSGTLLAACIELEHRPHCYAYALASGKELSPDYRFARRMAVRLGCDFTSIFIPRDRDQLEDDIREVISLLRVSRKTSVQCCHPLMHIARQVRRDGFDRAIAGTGGVVLDGRAVMVSRAEEGEEAARKLREEKLGDRMNPDTATGQMHIMALKCGVELVEPYSEDPLAAVGLRLDLGEMNSGPPGFGAKGIAVRAFPRFWMGSSWYRHPSPLQVNGGIRELHDELLTSPLNPNGAKRVVAVYNRILREIREPDLFHTA